MVARKAHNLEASVRFWPPQQASELMRARDRVVACNMWIVYILQCEDGSLYTGSTNNLPKRLLAHVEKKGARYTKSHPVKACVYQETCSSRGRALSREAAIKRLTRIEKQKLISTSA